MKECKKCGKISKENELYCSDCGAVFEKEKSALEKYSKFYLNLPTNENARSGMVTFFVIASVISFFLLSIQLLILFSGEVTKTDFLWLISPTVWLPAYFLIHFSIEMIIGCKTNYFSIEGENLILNLSFKKKVIPISDISGIVLIENKNIFKGPVTIKRGRYMSSEAGSVRNKVFGFKEKGSGKILFYSLQSDIIKEVFLSFGISANNI